MIRESQICGTIYDIHYRLCVCVNCQSLHEILDILRLHSGNTKNQWYRINSWNSGTNAHNEIQETEQTGSRKDNKSRYQLDYILLVYLIFKLHLHEFHQCQKTARSVWSGIPIPCHRCVIFYTFFYESINMSVCVCHIY